MGEGGNQPQPFCQRQFLEHHKPGLELWEVPQSEGGAGAAAAAQENSKGLRITIYSHKTTAFGQQVSLLTITQVNDYWAFFVASQSAVTIAHFTMVPLHSGHSSGKCFTKVTKENCLSFVSHLFGKLVFVVFSTSTMQELLVQPGSVLWLDWCGQGTLHPSAGSIKVYQSF